MIITIIKKDLYELNFIILIIILYKVLSSTISSAYNSTGINILKKWDILRFLV